LHATIRRYEGVDATRMNEVTSKVKETLVPQLRELPGFAAYYLIEAGNGVARRRFRIACSRRSTSVIARPAKAVAATP